MPSTPDLPLHLFQVLEEEYEALHGAFDKSPYDVALPDPDNPSHPRLVKARYDWKFDPSQLLDAAAFARDLLGGGHHIQKAGERAWATPTDWTRKNLIDYLQPGSEQNPPWFDQQALERLANGDGLPADLNSITESLNKLLETKFYSEDRVAYHWMSPPTRRTVEAVNPATLEGDNLQHFNRLLLEDAFPEGLFKVNDIRLAAIFKRIHLVQPRAICLSGGGIRSGTFGLGLLQGLARNQLLDKFHFLSTVSGGGYIGSWLSAWIHRHPQGLAGVTKELASDPRSKIDPDPDPILYLRRYSNFITPKVGLLTADTWTFIAIYLRNLFLNWMAFIPLLLAVLIIPRLIVAITLAQPEDANKELFSLSWFGFEWLVLKRHLFLAPGFLLGSWALGYVVFNRPRVREELRLNRRFWRSRSTQQSFLWWCLLPLTLSALSLTTYWAWFSEAVQRAVTRSRSEEALAFALFGLAFSFAGWFISFIVLRRWKPSNWKNNGFMEPIALLFSGVAGGAILWAIAQAQTLNAVIGYAEDKGSKAAFPWTFWSTTGDWTWLSWRTELYACLAVPIFMLTFLLAATLFVGISSGSVRFRVNDEDREWWARFGAWCLIVILVWATASVLVIFGPIAVLNLPKVFALSGGVSGLVAILLGRSSKTSAKPGKDNGQNKSGVLSRLGSSLLPLLAAVFIGIFLIALSLATTGIFQGVALAAKEMSWPALNEWLTNIPTSSHLYEGFNDYIRFIHSDIHNSDAWVGAKVIHMNVLHHSSIWFIAGLGLVFTIIGLGVSASVNLNLFSLHGGYRNRLIRAFLGASRPDHQRKPNPFTGFDEADNVNMHELRPGLLDEDDFLNPERLANMLSDAKDEALFDSQLLDNVRSITSRSPAPPRLLAALRKLFNSALEDKHLREKAAAIALPSAEQTGQANATDIELNRRVLERKFPDMLQPANAHIKYRLMPIINTTLNLVGGENLAWQQRKAEPFSVSPLHSGCFRLGYRDSRHYGGRETGGISIGTAATISGAAASSNMGYYTTSPVLSLVLTLFNVRLGWWLGNPGPTGNDTYDLRAPKLSILPVINEALGRTDDRNKYVYLTDGGHFENLAVYEMVLRRCHFILVSDGAADQHYTFGDLGNAVRKVRIDLGIPIEFTAMPIFARDPDDSKVGSYWAIGKIRYSCIDGPDAQDGLLLYVKPALYGNEPQDVLEYQRSHPTFPHQTTADQFFDEPQFESYRALGSHIANHICDAASVGDLRKAIKNARNILAPAQNPLDTGLSWVDDWLLDSKPMD
jgi:hypothetical protein